jgi:Zn-dependent protease
MGDPFTWSVPLGRLFGITVRVHVLFLLVAVSLVLRKMTPSADVGEADAMLLLMVLLFVAVLLHELGHCFAARCVGGEVSEIMLWPLGGFAVPRLPHSAAAHLVTAAAGPLVNLLLCAVSAAVLLSQHFQPSFSLLPGQAWYTLLQNTQDGRVYGSIWAGPPYLPLPTPIRLAAQFFWVNWVLFVFNVVVCGVPLDGARMLRAVLWPYLGYRSATLHAVFVSLCFVFIIGIAGIVMEELLLLCLAGVVYFVGKQEWITLETGGAGTRFGYDPSRGYPTQIFLPAPLKQFVDDEVKAGGFSSPAEYVLHVLQEAQHRRATTHIQDASLKEGVKSSEALPPDDAFRPRKEP